MTQHSGASDQPFPLRRYFLLGVLPALLAVIASIVYATSETARSSTIEILLQLASREVDGMAKGVERTAPEAWNKLLTGHPLDAANLAALRQAFADEQRETQVATFKIYGSTRQTVFANEAEEIGKIENKPALRDALALGTASVLVEEDAQGGAFYELYLPYRHGGRIVAVFEIYEPISGFDALVRKVIRPMLVIPLSLFAVMLGGLTWLVIRAQADIDQRTSLIVSLRQRLEALLSHRAVDAMRDAGAKVAAPELVDVTLLYSDVRGFTEFAERRSPREVIAFLNDIIGLQVEIIEAHGGDIDKMIGDAVLARFHGAQRGAQAMAAAAAIQEALKSSHLPRGVAIGLCDGPVVAGLIGTDRRLDYTVVGDTVNSAARLCGLAKAGEIVADSATAAMAPEMHFGPEEAVSVKGRQGKLAVRRFTSRSATGSAVPAQ